MIFPNFIISERKSKFLIPKVQFRNHEQSQKAKKQKILLLQSSSDFKDLTLNCTGVFSERSATRPNIKSIPSNKIQVDKAVGSSSPIFDHNAIHLLPPTQASKSKQIHQRFAHSAKASKRFKTLNITSPVFSLRKDFKVVLAGEHIFPSIILKS